MSDTSRYDADKTGYVGQDNGADKQQSSKDAAHQPDADNDDDDPDEGGAMY